MNTKIQGETVMSPNTFVISSYVPTDNINLKVTPDIKTEDSTLLFIDLAYGNHRVGGSQLGVILENLGSDAPRFTNIDKFPEVFNKIQNLIVNGKILAGHDRSDGGLITTLIEMTIASNYGIIIDIDNKYSKVVNPVSYLMNEELGLVIEVCNNDSMVVKEYISDVCPCYIIGHTTDNARIKVNYNQNTILDNTSKYYWNLWEKTSFKLEEKQCNINCVKMEKNSINNRTNPRFSLNQKLIDEINLITIPKSKYLKNNYRSDGLNSSSDSIGSFNFNSYTVGIIREEGSNGDREMSAAFYSVGFNVLDITMNDIINSKDNILLKLNGLAFVGGFSFSDALGSSVGWSATINFNKDIKRKFDEFYNKPDTFSLGVCNGCQLMSLIGWIPEVRLVHNNSERFESRCVQLKVLESNCIFTKDMENVVFNMWSAHGEGKFILSQDFDMDKNIKLSNKLENQLSPMRYVDDIANITNEYPFNPNGSPEGIASICSSNGRHMAIMPHPERCFLKWQLPFIPEEISQKLANYSPWIYLFKNAYNFCKSMQEQDISINEVFI